MSHKSVKRNSAALLLARYMGHVVFFPFFSIRIQGLENIPSQGSFILLPKHQRWEDIPLLGLAVKRPLYFMAKKELFDSILSRWFISLLGGIPVDRQRPAINRASYERMVKLLKEGEGIVVFPEGTYYRDRMGPGRSGLIRMAVNRAETLFLPVGIRYGVENLRTRVDISIGRPVDEGLYDDWKSMTDRVMEEIGLLSGLKGQGLGRLEP